MIYGVVAISGEWRSDYQPVMNIDLSFRALPSLLSYFQRSELSCGLYYFSRFHFGCWVRRR